MNQKNNKVLFEKFIDQLEKHQGGREELETFIKGILTPTELEEISRRLEIVKLLKQGMPQHEIARKLGVGVATVTRGSKEISRGNLADIEI
jgi:TrpR family trp operon transcriptional repressor